MTPSQALDVAVMNHSAVCRVEGHEEAVKAAWARYVAAKEAFARSLQPVSSIFGGNVAVREEDGVSK